MKVCGPFIDVVTVSHIIRSPIIMPCESWQDGRISTRIAAPNFFTRNMGQEISQQSAQQNGSKKFSKQKICKTYSTQSSCTDTSSGYQTTSTSSGKIKPILVYDQITPESSILSHNSGSSDYYSSHHSSSTSSSGSVKSSRLSTASTSSSSIQSSKSLHKQKDYLNHHLYIKSYLDIAEEDEKARENFKPARPGIRNYTPKILAEKKPPTGSNKDEIWI